MEIDTVVAATVAMLFGSMLFFALIVAPTVFKALQPESAGIFLRTLFPRYYTWGIAMSAVAALVGLSFNNLTGFLLATVALMFVLARQWLMPRINQARDAGSAGDTQAAIRFKRLHGVSVAVNLVQMVILATVFVTLASAW